MKLACSIALLALTLLFASCTKSDISVTDSISESVSNDATTPDLSKCKIRRIYQNYDEESVVTAVFSYNKAGNPYSVLYSAVTGYPYFLYNHFFLYDFDNRLSEYQIKLGDWVAERHFYSYNSSNQIVADSALYGNPGDGSYPYETVSTIEYDVKGRVIRETIVNVKNDYGPVDRTRRPTYTYDSRGNLGVTGWKSSSYDYKINPLRQNPIFQFIHRNYSMNNPSVQPRYNSIGLPLSLQPYNDNFFNEGGPTKIIYDCQ